MQLRSFHHDEITVSKSQKPLVFEVLKLFKLILTVPATNAARERSRQRCAESKLTCDI